MMNRRGDVVLVRFPFADGVGSKLRPALVVQCDANNRRLENTIIVQITSRIQFAESEPTQLLIALASSEGKQSGLKHDSAVSCENIMTIRQDLIVRKLGSLSAEVLRKVEECLKSSLEIK